MDKKTIEALYDIKIFKCRCSCGCKQEHTSSYSGYCNDCQVGDCPCQCSNCGRYTTRDSSDGLCDSCADKAPVYDDTGSGPQLTSDGHSLYCPRGCCDDDNFKVDRF